MAAQFAKVIMDDDSDGLLSDELTMHTTVRIARALNLYQLAKVTSVEYRWLLQCRHQWLTFFQHDRHQSRFRLSADNVFTRLVSLPIRIRSADSSYTCRPTTAVHPMSEASGLRCRRQPVN